MSAVVVFSGPTLPPEIGRSILPDALFAGPAACGDVYRACRTRPRVIALIDGYFEHALPVWHKELLWAMHHGIRVYGAASMGALRAAEMAEFGMIGTGVIYGWYRDGTLADDDDVAVIHETAAQGYRPKSDALVNVRATLLSAQANDVITAEHARAILDCGKALFYPDRTYAAILQQAERAGLPQSVIMGLRSFATDHAVDQKRHDALALLALIGRDVEHVARPGSSGSQACLGFRFEYTESWHNLRRRLDNESRP